MAKAHKAGSAETPRRAPQSSGPSGRERAREETGESDENYNLISVLYHTLQGAETISQYLRDAQDADDEELVSFFEETKRAYLERAREAKQILASRLEEGLEDDEDEDEDEDDDEDEDEDED